MSSVHVIRTDSALIPVGSRRVPSSRQAKRAIETTNDPLSLLSATSQSAPRQSQRTPAENTTPSAIESAPTTPPPPAQWHGGRHGRRVAPPIPIRAPGKTHAPTNHANPHESADTPRHRHRPRPATHHPTTYPGTTVARPRTARPRSILRSTRPPRPTRTEPMRPYATQPQASAPQAHRSDVAHHPQAGEPHQSGQSCTVPTYAASTTMTRSTRPTPQTLQQPAHPSAPLSSPAAAGYDSCKAERTMERTHTAPAAYPDNPRHRHATPTGEPSRVCNGCAPSRAPNPQVPNGKTSSSFTVAFGIALAWATSWSRPTERRNEAFTASRQDPSSQPKRPLSCAAAHTSAAIRSRYADSPSRAWAASARITANRSTACPDRPDNRVG